MTFADAELPPVETKFPQGVASFQVVSDGETEHDRGYARSRPFANGTSLVNSYCSLAASRSIGRYSARSIPARIWEAVLPFFFSR